MPSTAPDERTLTGLLVGLILLGIVLVVANVPGSPLRGSTLGDVGPLGHPVLVALVAHVRFSPTARW